MSRVVSGRLEIDRTPRDNGRDSVFIDHLRHCIAQQDDILVKRLDLALQFNAVNQINRHRHVFTAQLVEEGILQELAFIGHDMLRVQTLLEKLLKGLNITTPTLHEGSLLKYPVYWINY